MKVLVNLLCFLFLIDFYMISIVTTLYYSEKYIQKFYNSILRVCSNLNVDFELILVNDGSPDNSLNIAVEIHKNDKKVIVIDLSKNFGHYNAILTGLKYAKGDYVFFIDSDLEEDPENLYDFYKSIIQSDYDVIYGVQNERRGNLVNKFTGYLFYKTINFLTDLNLSKNICASRIMNRKYVDSLLLHNEKEVFIAGLWQITGFCQKSIPIKKESSSKSTYTFKKKINIILNAVTSFSVKPLLYISYIGFIILFFSILYTFYIFYLNIFESYVLSGWTSLILSIWIIGGLTISILGIISLYLSKIFLEVKSRPLTIIKDFYGAKD